MSIEESARHPSSLQSDLTRAPASALDTPSASPQRFVDHGDGTVTDVQTGLMWMRCAEGQNWIGIGCTGAAKEFTYEEARAIGREFAGFGDWRLPTLDELRSIVDQSRNRPTIGADSFCGCENGSQFWTSTIDCGVWQVNFHSGASYAAARNERNRVRLVRKATPLKEHLAKSKSEELIRISPNVEHPTQSSVQGAVTCLSASALDTPSASPQRFVDHGDGTVTDVQTGLMWMRCAEGQTWTGSGCIGAAKEITFMAAQAIRRVFAGFSDWRLPTHDELKSIVDTSRTGPTIDTDIFYGCESAAPLFWTSPVDGKMWQVSFRFGVGYYASDNSHDRVRLVRKTTLPKELLTLLKELLTLLKELLSKSKSEAPISISPNPEKPAQLSVQGDLTHLSSSALEVPAASPQRFIDHGDGTVTDVQTGLMWMRCVEGQNWTGAGGTGAAKEFTFEAAQAIRREFAGFSDWRLPTLDELKSIVDPSRTRPTIDTDIFYGCDSTGPLFWTSTDHNGVWYVSFYSGTSYSATRNARNRVRLVRSISPQKAQISGSNSNKHQEDSSHSIERQDINIDYLLRDIERSEQPSPSFINAVFKNPSIVECRGGKFSRTLLHHAAALGKINIVKYLCSMRLVDMNCADSEGDTPLDYASRSSGSKSIEIVNYLRSQGAKTRIEMNDHTKLENPDAQDNSLLISESVKKALKEALTEHSIQRGDLVNFVHRNPHLINAKLFDQGKTMLDLATEAGRSQIVRWLIGKCALAKTADGVGNSLETTSGLQDTTNQANTATLSFSLDVLKTGFGNGTVSIIPDLKTYTAGSRVKLTAQPAEGSMFAHWAGDLSGFDCACSLMIDAPKQIIANFERLDIPELSLGVAVDVIEQSTMQSGDEAFIVYLSITNKAAKQARIELPCACYVTCHGEEFEQDVWLRGLINGGEGASIRAGNFKKAGLVFYKSKLASISAGDCLHITVLQTKPSQRFNFSFRCTSQASHSFVLVKAELEELTVQPEPDLIEVLPEKSEILQRLDLLQSGLDEILRRLERLEAAPVAVAQREHTPIKQEETAPTLTDVLAWLASQQQVSVAALRHRLLPLDVLPSALIDEVNERALDLVGEPALEEQDDEVLVIQEVLTDLLASWDGYSV